MTLKNIFLKPVDRPIEGVIKADDEASLRLEIEEYVLTNEVEKRLEEFLDAYNNYEGANGVWVSGFFGSGKSHLLKMLALLLENREMDGATTLDLFLPKCSENEILRGDLKRAVSIPAKSILFNIDQKADVISKTQIDALLAVFVKVFDEMCGYYGKQGHIAQFERDLDGRGLYEQFKAEYETIAAIKQAVSIPVFANGDIDSPQKAKAVLDATGADALLIGRAAQGRPWIFREIEHYLRTGSTLPAPGLLEVERILLEHLAALHAFYGELMGVRIARKHVGWYLATLPGAREFRARFNRLDSTDAQCAHVREFFRERHDDGNEVAA